MKTLEDIARERPQYYADMACQANLVGKSLAVQNDEIVLIETKQPELNYQELRSLEYPAISEQLDMLYWDKINGTNLWQEKISEVKTKYPKQEEVIENEQ